MDNRENIEGPNQEKAPALEAIGNVLLRGYDLSQRDMQPAAPQHRLAMWATSGHG
jgi:hypothetical protein